MWLLDKFLTKAIRTGRLVVTDHDGKVYQYGPGADGPDGGDEIRIRLTHRKAARHIASYPVHRRRGRTGKPCRHGR